MKQKYLTIGFILIGVVFALFNFYIFNRMNNGGLPFDLKKVAESGQTNAKAQAVLPDIKPGESYTKSKIRDKEIAKIKNRLPIDSNLFSIVYDGNTKYLTGTIKATTIEKYRENKFLAEEKIYEIGAESICVLNVVWAVPIPLKTKINKQDLTTRSCSG